MNDRFEHDFPNLLQHLDRKSRILVMFELPAPPFKNKYSEIQRRLALKYKVTSILISDILHVFSKKQGLPLMASTCLSKDISTWPV